MTDRGCHTCKHLAVPPDKAGRVVVRKGNVYRCEVVVPMPALPTSITDAFNFRWPPPRTYMTRGSGATCPMWEARAKGGAA